MTTTKPPNQYDRPVGAGHDRIFSTGIVINIQDPAQKKQEAAHNVQVRIIGEQQQGISHTNPDVPDKLCQWMPSSRSNDESVGGSSGTPQHRSGQMVRVCQYARDEFEIMGSLPKGKMGPGQSYNERTTNPESTKSYRNEQRGKPWGNGSWGNKSDGSDIPTSQIYKSSTTQQAFSLRTGGQRYEEQDDYEATKTKMQRPEAYDMKAGMKEIGKA